MLRLVHPPQEGQGSRSSGRRRSPCASLTPDEKRHLRTALHNLRRAYGTWSCVAEAMDVREKSIEHTARARNPQGSTSMPSAPLARAAWTSVLPWCTRCLYSGERSRRSWMIKSPGEDLFIAIPREELAAFEALPESYAPPASAAGLLERYASGERYFVGACLAGWNLVGRDLRNIDLRVADLRGARLSGADLRGAVLCGADMRDACFDDVDFRGCELLQVNEKLAWIAAAFRQRTPTPSYSFITRLDRASLQRANLRGTELEEVSFIGASLVDANMQEARFSGPREHYITSVTLKGADMSRADLRGASVRCTDFSGVTLVGANLRNLSFYAAKLVGADLRDADMRGAELNASGHGVWDAHMLPDLSDANLQGAMLAGADLRKAQLRRAKLSGVDLRGANMTQANLSGSDLRETLLEGADLSGANLSGAQARGVRLGPLISTDPRKRTLLCGCLLEGADLRGADLREANLTRAHLAGADLSGAMLIHANLSRANLARAKLERTDLRNAVLASTKLDSVDLATALLAGARHEAQSAVTHETLAQTAKGLYGAPPERIEEVSSFLAACGVPMELMERWERDTLGLTLYFDTRLTPFDQYLVHGVIFGVLGCDTDCRLVAYEERENAAIVRLQASHRDALDAVAEALYRRVWEQHRRAHEQELLRLADAVVGATLERGLSDLRGRLDRMTLDVGGTHALGNEGAPTGKAVTQRAWSWNLRDDRLSLPRPIRMVTIHAAVDCSFHDALTSHLAVLVRQGVVEIRAARDVAPGVLFREAVQQNIADSDVVVVLVSADVFASDSIVDHELGYAFERARAGTTVLVPLIIRPTDLDGSPFDGLRAVPANSRPITQWEDRDAAWAQVVLELRRVLRGLSGEKCAGELTT